MTVEYISQVLAHALHAAGADAFYQWQKRSCNGIDKEVCYTSYCRKVTMFVTLKPHLPASVQIKVHDNRPGKSVEEHYVVERPRTNPKLRRWRQALKLR